MGKLSQKHKKNRGERYERRKAAQALRHHANQHPIRGRRRFALSINPEWLLRMADKEDAGCTSVGGLAVDMGWIP